MRVRPLVLSLAASLLAAGLLAACGNPGPGPGPGPGGGGVDPGGTTGKDLVDVDLVLVSRPIPDQGSIYWDAPRDLPGVGAHSRFRVTQGSRLVVLHPDGTARILVDGSQPTDASLNLVDVNAPSVSWDGQSILFAGLPQGTYDPDPANNPGAWRLYRIRADGTGLTQLTHSDQTLTFTQFGEAANGLQAYDDTDPAFLPDGRIVFTSTRWPAYGHYSGVRASNLFVMNADGSGLHRITAERNGADRALVDPVTGKIVYSRWWRNHRFPIDDMTTIPVDASNLSKGYVQKDGVTSDRNNPVGGPSMFRNAWQAATINPDGTGLAMWSGTFRDEEANHLYGGAFTQDGDLLANFFPMYNMTEAAGFGGIRRLHRGPGRYTPVMGITYLTLDYAHASGPTSYGIFKGEYATEPDVLPDGRMIASIAADVGQDYGLYVLNADGSNRKLLWDHAGTSDLRAHPLAARTVPPVLPDTTGNVPSLLPPKAAGPYDVDGTFTFAALNVYANGPVDADIVSAVPVGSAAKIRFFIDHQRTSPGSFPSLDWPILLGEKAIAPDGSVTETQAPANVQLFEQLRTPANKVPVTGGPDSDGAAHVAGMNFGRPGTVARCVGCHAGHTLIPVPANDADAQWTNLAPGAAVEVSSTRDAQYNGGVIDRRVNKGEIWRAWTSAQNQTTGQWVKLTFPVPVSVRTVRLYNPRQGGEANSTLQVGSATVKLFSDAAGTVQVAQQLTPGALALTGTDVAFQDVKARVVKVELGATTGTFYGMKVASLAEIEVIARGEAP